MSKPIQTVEELDAVLHWRGKHTQAIRERDALQQRQNAADERWDELVSAVRSINYGPAHKITVPGDDEPQYRQRKEWIEWVLGLCDTPIKPAEGGKPSTCTWSEGGFSWHTGCGKEWKFTDGGLPSENGMEFCHSCGKKLIVEETGAETEKEDDWRMNPCKQGHRDVGAAGGVAACNECDEKIEAPTTQEAFERWNATHPKL